MVRSLVLVSHGIFCEELKKSTEMIMGPQEDIYTVALLPEEGPEDFQKNLKKQLQDWKILLSSQTCWAVHQPTSYHEN